MPERQDNRARFLHLFSSPLTSLRGAVDLLRHPSRATSDPVTRELIEAIERNLLRLSSALGILLQHSRVDGKTVECIALLREFGLDTEPQCAAGTHAETLPVLAQPEAKAPAATIAVERIAAALVLMIGSFAERQQSVYDTLAGSGYQVHVFEHGAAGLDWAREYRPDLILLDHNQRQAYDLMQVLREDPDTKAIPVIHVASQTAAALELPAAPNLLPFDATPDELNALVLQSIAAARSRSDEVPVLLIVDDDADIQRIVALHMQQDGFRVVVASDGAAALRAAQKQPFDLIILDLLLPDIDGFSVLGALRARSATAMTPIILLSARDTPQEKADGLYLGADDYITKPFSAVELRARVRAALRRHEREAGANPSTRLPGNISIERALRQRIDQGAPFAVCYADIDNFKAYNDTYSFLKGDAVIHQTAHILVDATAAHGNHNDFVGHIGGDDFVVITTPECAEQICRCAIANFDRVAPLLYDAATRARGYIDALDRQGRPAHYPFVSLSIGIVSTEYQAIQHVAEVAQRSVEPKKRAKERIGSGYVFED